MKNPMHEVFFLTENAADEVDVAWVNKCVDWAVSEASKPYELCEWNQFDIYVSRDSKDFTALKKAPECGSCYCIAGYIVYSLAPEMLDSGENRCELADELLGLTNISHTLYVMNNTIDDVKAIAANIIAGPR